MRAAAPAADHIAAPGIARRGSGHAGGLDSAAAAGGIDAAVRPARLLSGEAAEFDAALGALGLAPQPPANASNGGDSDVGPAGTHTDTSADSESAAAVAAVPEAHGDQVDAAAGVATRLRACATVQQVMAIVAQQDDALEAAHVAAALHKVAYLAPSTDRNGAPFAPAESFQSTGPPSSSCSPSLQAA